MNLLQKLKTKKGLLHIIELIFALLFIIPVRLIEHYIGIGVAIEVSAILLLLFVILLIIFFKQHPFGIDKPLLTALSIYYKSVTYVTIIFITGNFPGRVYIDAVAVISMIVYAVFSYLYGRRNN
ncbi:MAG: hypothetical protein FWC41_11455, partial [Firmicutes bacterium]|nr:hypothetical protein [Bacillota bacterium]